MARFNSVTLLGRVYNMVAKPVGKDKTDGVEGSFVLNFLLECYSEEDKRSYRIPVAVWGEREVTQCLEHLNEGDLALVQGEVRYKFIRVDEKDELGNVRLHPKTKRPIQKVERVYTAVKASTVEFLSKKMKKEELFYHSINEIRLIGNLVDEPKKGEEGFVIAVDRLYPTKQTKSPNHQLTDYVTLLVSEESVIRGNLKKGSVAIIDGKLMTRRMQGNMATPTIVVDVKRMVGR